MHDIEEKNLNSLKYIEYSYAIKDIRRTNLPSEKAHQE